MAGIVNPTYVAACDFQRVAGSPRLVDGSWHLDDQDVIAYEFPMGRGHALQPGARILGLETDIAIGLGYLDLYLVHHSAPGSSWTYHLGETNAASPQRWPIRRVVSEGGSVELRISASMRGDSRIVHGVTLHTVHALHRCATHGRCEDHADPRGAA